MICIDADIAKKLLPTDLPADLPANCSIMLGSILDQEADPCANIDNRYNMSDNYHIKPENYVPSGEAAGN